MSEEAVEKERERERERKRRELSRRERGIFGMVALMVRRCLLECLLCSTLF
jgi:hypothetical protein